ncbi:MAG TPA: methyl-accepting chemotaxis protein [Planctomycetota bacterium]|nr:methyl-accepting chemotaxis protein [Planctomycetota bacterium]
MLKQASLKTRLVTSISALVTVLTVVTCAVILGIGWNALDEIALQSRELSNQIKRREQAALEGIAQSQRKADLEFFDLKAVNLAKHVARQAGTSLATGETDTLQENIKQLYTDNDVALCLVFRETTSAEKPGAKQAVIVSTLANESNALIKELLKKEIGKRELQKMADELTKLVDRVKVVEEKIAMHGEEYGRAQIFLSLDKLNQREAELKSSLEKLEKDNEQQFTQFNDTITKKKEAKLSSAIFETIVLAIIAILVTVAVVVFIANSITRPIGAAVSAAERVANGDLTSKVRVEGEDETGQLLAAIQQMTENLNSLVSQVKHSSIQLVATATTITNNVKQQQATVNDFGSSTAQIAAAAKEITATSKELLTTMNDVSSVSSETATLADTGRTNLTEMEKTIGQLGSATQSISSKLSVIREKADEINVVVTTITKVADQTNLLSLNASIEAEKAGEYGLGFAVVAREIRRLADQTAVATLDIEQMVKEMQGAVSAGVMEMDRFSQDVKRGVEEVARIGVQQARIIERVQALTPRFKSVNEGMHAQSQGAEQISDAMVQLNDGARRTVTTLEEFSKAADNLHQAVSGLKEEVSRFKVAS